LAVGSPGYISSGPLIEPLRRVLVVRHINLLYDLHICDEWEDILYADMPSLTADDLDQLPPEKLPLAFDRLATIASVARRLGPDSASLSLSDTQVQSLAADLVTLLDVLRGLAIRYKTHVERSSTPSVLVLPAVVVRNSPDAALVSADPAASPAPTITLSTQFLRRLLGLTVETMVASASDGGNTDDSFTVPVELPRMWRGKSAATIPGLVEHSLELVPIVPKEMFPDDGKVHMFDSSGMEHEPPCGYRTSAALQAAAAALEVSARDFDRAVLPSARVAFNKVGAPGLTFDAVVAMQAQQRGELPILIALEKAGELPLPTVARTSLRRIANRINSVTKMYAATDDADRDEDGAEGLTDCFGDALQLRTFALFAEQEYLKELTFVLGHEAAHLWLPECRPGAPDAENLADAFAVLMSFQVFGNYYKRSNLVPSVEMAIIGPKAESSQAAPESDPEDWLLGEVAGRSGFRMIRDVFGENGVPGDTEHASLAVRKDLVESYYKRLLKESLEAGVVTSQR